MTQQVYVTRENPKTHTFVAVGIVTHKHGTNMYAGKTEQDVLAQIADYCRDYWKQEGLGEGGPPEDDSQCIAEYFSGIDYRESCEVAGGVHVLGASEAEQGDRAGLTV